MSARASLFTLSPSPRSDVRDSLKNAQDLYSRWCMLLEDQSDLEKTQGVSTDLRSCIKSIEWDLQDLDETISE